MLRKLSLAASLAMMVAAPAFAQDPAPEAKKPTPNPWVDCGLGATIFPGTPLAAVLSNVIWDYGLTGTTSAMSSPDMCEGKRVKTAMFINTTYTQLAAETAIGQGQHLAAMADLMECSESARPQLVALTRERMAEVMSQPGFSELANTRKAEAYFLVVDEIAQTDLAAQCRAA